MLAGHIACGMSCVKLVGGEDDSCPAGQPDMLGIFAPNVQLNPDAPVVPLAYGSDLRIDGEVGVSWHGFQERDIKLATVAYLLVAEYISHEVVEEYV
jgi:hypothetical protein